MIDRDRLVGWLCIMRHNLRGDGQVTPFDLPTSVREALLDEGWITCDDGRTEDGRKVWNVEITEAGTTVSDLCAPEWGIDPVPAA